MVLVSVQSVETDNGYSFKNDFAESLIIDPNSKISLINIQFSRSVDYVVLQGGNAFEIKVGDAIAQKDIIGIAPGTYTAFTLATAIQVSLNNAYHTTGHTFVVDVKDGKFEISNTFRSIPLPKSHVAEWDTKTLAYVETASTIWNHKGALHLGVSPADRVHTDAFTGITDGTANYIQSASKLETNYVPKLADGGSYAEFTLTFSGSVYPAPPGVGQHNRGFILGLNEKFGGAKPSKGIKQPTGGMCANVNLDWCDNAMVFFTDESENPHVKFIEGNQDIGVDIKFAPLTGDTYRITFSSDNVYPQYSYKRNGGVFTTFNIKGASQRLSDWENTDLRPIVCADSCDGVTTGPVINCWTTNLGSGNVLPIPVVATSTNDTHKYTADATDVDTGTIARAIVGGADGYNTMDGLLLQYIDADSYTDFEFSLVPNGGDFYVSILDAQTLFYNSITNTPNTDGTQIAGGPAYGMRTQTDFTSEAQKDKNASVFTYRFNAWDTTADGYDTVAGAVYPSNKVYKRDNFNAYNTVPGGVVTQPFVECNGIDGVPSGFDWTSATNPNPTFLVRVEGNANKVQLYVRPTKDQSLILLDESKINPTFYDGLKVLNANTDGVGFTPNATPHFALNEVGNKKAVFIGATDADGHIDMGIPIQVINAGLGYNTIQGYEVIEIDAVTGVRIGTGVSNSTVTLTDYDNGANMGVAYDSGKVVNGYKLHASFGSKAVASVTNVVLRTTQPGTQDDYFELYPRYEEDFGAMLGYQKEQYIVNNDGKATSEGPAVPNQQVDLNPTLIVNVDNLPHKSYIGKGVKSNATLTSGVVGSLQGLTKMIGKVPRHHDDNGDGSKANAGPFYFDYFPYSIPLRNATELTINELDISIRNPNGTLATDITEAHLLLDITNVEGAGEAVNQGSIGRPIEAPMNYDRLNVPKSQLEPSLRGGFAQTPAKINEQPARHIASDSHNALNPMGHL